MTICTDDYCTTPVPDEPDNLCGGDPDGGPSRAGCGEPYCDQHLLVTGSGVSLRPFDYDNAYA